MYNRKHLVKKLQGKVKIKEKYMNLKVNNKLREVLKQKGISPYRLAKDLKITDQQMYQSILKPNKMPTLARAYAITEYLGVSVYDVWVIENKWSNSN